MAFRISDAMFWSFKQFVGDHPGGGTFAMYSTLGVYMVAVAAGAVFFVVGSICQIVIRKKTLKYQILFETSFTVMFGIAVVLIGANITHL